MRLARLGPVGAERPVVLDGERVLDLSATSDDVDGRFLGGDGLERARLAWEAGDLPELADTASLRVGAPIARPSAVLCVGMNYAAHAAESGSAAPEVPIIFQKTPNTVVGPDDPVTIPPGSTKTDWEVELGIVIGRRASYLSSREESMAHVAGFVLCNDLSERTFQLEVSGGQWGKGKSVTGLLPDGTVAGHSRRGRPPRAAAAQLGQRRAPAGLKHLRHGLRRRAPGLEPEPVPRPRAGRPHPHRHARGRRALGPLRLPRAGDVVELEIDGLGRQRQEMEALR